MLSIVTYSPRQVLLLFCGCVVLGVGVAMLLTADLGSDGYSTFVNGIAIRTGITFWVANLLVGVTLVALAAARRVHPDLASRLLRLDVHQDSAVVAQHDPTA